MAQMHSPPGPYTLIDGKRVLYFAGTAYLGLQGDRSVIEAACDAAHTYGMGPATSRGGFGDVPPVLDVEKNAARFMGHEDAFYFASGYAGPSILARALADAYDTIFIDEHAHYALQDAALATGLPTYPFTHCDPTALAASMRQHAPRTNRILIMTDGLFSVLGDIAPVAAYRRVLEERETNTPTSQSIGQAAIMIDDAHGLGVLGPNGRGTAEANGIASSEMNLSMAAPNEDQAVARDAANRVRIYQCATLSKAMGGFGGIITGSTDFIAYLKEKTPYFRGAGGPPPAVAAGSATAIDTLLTDRSPIEKLANNVRYLRKHFAAGGINVETESPSPIICLRQGQANAMRQLQRDLFRQGIAIAYIHTYSGLSSEGALRISVTAQHDQTMMDQLADAMIQYAL